MNLTKKEKTIKYAVYCLLLLVSGLLQNVGGMWFEIGRARCFFLIPVAVSLGIDEDERVASLLGLFAGLIWDMVSVQHMGFNFVFFMLVCYFSSFLVSYLLRATYWVTAASAVVAVAVYCLLYWLLCVVIGGGEGAVSSLGYFYIPSMLYTSAFTLVIVMLLRPVKRRLNKETVIG